MIQMTRKTEKNGAEATQVKPWTLEERNRVRAKLDREAEFMARRVHAAHVAVIAFFPKWRVRALSRSWRSADIFRAITQGLPYRARSVAGVWWKGCGAVMRKLDQHHY